MAVVGVASRIKGQPALRARLARRVKALTGDLIALQRFVMHRARTADAQARAGKALAILEVARGGVQDAHDVLDADEPAYPRRPVKKRTP